VKRRYKAETKSKAAKTRKGPLFAIKLRNVKTGSLIMAHFYSPVPMRNYDNKARQMKLKWTCPIRFNRDGKLRTASGSGPDWLASVLLAVDFVRMQIPESEDRDWQSKSLGEAWAILPRRLPVSPGYELYHRLSGYLDSEEEKYIAKQTKEQEAAERKALMPRRRRKRWPDPERAAPG
jgi:hypothetical protein